jgi:hypothetical protein
MARRYTRDNRGRFSSTGATARGGRLRTAAGNKRATQTTKLSGGKASGTISKPKGLKPGAIKAKPQVSTTRKEQLAAGAQRRNAQANRIDAKVKALEGQYRSKDAAFYTQGAKPAGRDRMIAKSQQAAQLREQSAALRTKAANAEKMSKQTKGTAASKKQERRNDFDAAGYKVGDTVTTRQYGTQKITKISKNSVSFDKGNVQDKAFMANYLQLQAKPANPASTARQAATAAGPRTGAQSGVKRRTTRAAAPRNTTANRTGQSKTLNKFNSRPVGTMVAGKGINLTPSTKRVPLNIAQKASDQAFARTATKAARTRALIPAKTQQKQTTAQRATRAATNQSRVTQAVLAKSSRRPTRKQRRSILTAESAKRFYATKAVDYLKVNVKKPGFRLPRGMR